MNPRRLYTQQCMDAALGVAGTGSPHGRATDKPVSIPVFRSRLIEQVFAKAHPITPIIWFGPILGYAGYTAIRHGGPGALQAIALFAAGWLVWTLMEYTLHRFLFHMPAESPDEKLRAFLIHGYHHQFPSDPMRLVAPPLMSWPIAVVVAFAYRAMLGTGDAWLHTFAGTCAGYIAYDWIHYYTHHFHPKWALGKWLRKYHMLHHFEDNGTRYGISSPLWDFVFRTYRPVNARRRDLSATRSLDAASATSTGMRHAAVPTGAAGMGRRPSDAASLAGHEAGGDSPQRG